MKYIVIKTAEGTKVVLNLDSVISFSVKHPSPEKTLTMIETTKLGCVYYVDGDITKDLITLIKSSKDSVFATFG